VVRAERQVVGTTCVDEGLHRSTFHVVDALELVQRAPGQSVLHGLAGVRGQEAHLVGPVVEDRGLPIGEVAVGRECGVEERAALHEEFRLRSDLL
jgi:hypothetical protein